MKKGAKIVTFVVTDVDLCRIQP